MKSYIQNQLVVLIIATTLLSSCAPVFSDMQSARTVGKNRVELTPSYSKVKFNYDGESEVYQTQAGMQVAYGLTSKIDIRARYEYLRFDMLNSFAILGSNNKAQVFGIGPKLNVINQYLSIYLPFGRAFGEYADDSWQFHPTIIATIPAVKNKLDINSSVKYLVPLQAESQDNLLAFNFGLALSNNLNRWAIRPEYGILMNPTGDGYFNHLSLGISYVFGK